MESQDSSRYFTREFISKVMTVGRVRVRGILKTVRAVRVVCSSLLKCRKDGERGAIENGGEVDGERATATSQPGTTGRRGGKRAKSRSFYSRQGRNTVVRRLLSILKLYVAGIASPIPPTLAAFAGLLTPLLYACEIRVSYDCVSFLFPLSLQFLP